MDVRQLLKVYNYVNDEKKPRVNLMFAGALVAFLVAGGAFVAFFMLQDRADAPGAAPPESRTEYVGLTPQEVQSGSIDSTLVAQRWDAWKADHPNATIEDVEEVREGPLIVGYRVTYHEG